MSEGGFKKRKRPAGISALQSVKDETADWDSEGSVESLDDLLAFRKLKRATGGIDLEKLNSGDGKRDASLEPAADVKKLDNGMLEGTDGGLKMMSRETNKILKNDSFTGQTNIVDVNKHMMAYVEEQMRKKKEAQNEQSDDPARRTTDQSDESSDANNAAADLGKLPGNEGSITSSAGMLTSIPEVDLGIDSKLRNIQETEKARRILLEKQKDSGQQNSSKREDEDFLHIDRFYRHRAKQDTDPQALERARKEALKTEQERQTSQRSRPSSGTKREVATDDQVVDRFKKRMLGKK